METNAHMMETCVVYVTAVNLNQKPPCDDVELALGYLRRRPRLSHVRVEVDTVGVLAEATRRGWCDAVKVLVLNTNGGTSSRGWSEE